MIAAALIHFLEEKGVEVTPIADGKVKLRAIKGTLTDELMCNVALHKAEVASHFRAKSNLKFTFDQSIVDEVASENQKASQSYFFKEYKYPNGQVIKLTKEEFYEVVEIFRTLENWRKNESNK